MVHFTNITKPNYSLCHCIHLTKNNKFYKNKGKIVLIVYILEKANIKI